MNKRAEELGCKNTHIVTSNGLHKEDHYTCARDMALIAREAYKYPELIEYMSKMNYHFEKSKKQPDDFWLLNTNDFLTEQIYYEGVIAGPRDSGHLCETGQSEPDLRDHEGRTTL